ncbi:MAG: MmcB family DNA repair protein [Pseudomonadota bacterium]
MPIVSIAPSNPFVDARQSERAMAVRTGCERYFAERNWVTLPELALSNGRRADLVALSPRGDVAIVEVKSSITDFRADHKWPEYQAFCDELFFATLTDVPAHVFPEEAGFMVADVYGAEVVRTAPTIKMTPARRKALHLTFARASAQRLARCCAHTGDDAGAFMEEGDG